MTSLLTLSPEKLISAAEILKTMAHPTRMAIVNMLDLHGKMNVSSICKELGGADQSLTSHHLSNMRAKGILKTQREGRHIWYSLKLEEITEVIQCVVKCQAKL